jgi:hypothetical protein
MEYANEDISTRPIVKDHDQQVLVPFLTKHLNCWCAASPTHLASIMEDSLWGVEVLAKETSISF